ncbi:MAG: hypothetical protein J5948_05785 [Bacteroidales bacterium]|nr:hypothetical protein [Bacteroidales bacterium]
MEMTFADFILQHASDDPFRLLLSRDKFPDIDIDIAVTTLEVRRKLRTKVPEWYAVPSLVYPSRLSGEQCSSSETARYKASLIKRMVSGGSVAPQPSLRDPSQRFEGALPPIIPRGSRPISPADSASAGRSDERRDPSTLRIADLTGGMGVDSWAFAEVAEEVLYNEMQEGLAQATERNFKELGVENVRFRNCRVEPGRVGEVLDGFRPDVIFLDPARRAEDGRKVFLIEDCQPDVLTLLPELFQAGRFVLLKLSPMADITMACKRLSHVREVHVVAAGGECKELLFLLDRDWDGPHATYVVEGGSVMAVPGQTGNEGDAPVIPGEATPVISSEAKESYSCLFEPGKALLKAGAFGLPSGRYGLTKLGTHTHLYVGEAVPEELRPFGKCFEILEFLPLNNRTLKEAGKRYPQAEVTARNIPMTSDLLRKKLGCASGGAVHLFGVRVDAAADPGNYLIITKRQTYGND